MPYNLRRGVFYFLLKYSAKFEQVKYMILASDLIGGVANLYNVHFNNKNLFEGCQPLSALRQFEMHTPHHYYIHYAHRTDIITEYVMAWPVLCFRFCNQYFNCTAFSRLRKRSCLLHQQYLCIGIAGFQPEHGIGYYLFCC